MKINKRTLSLAAFIILLTALILMLIFAGEKKSEKEKIGFIMTGAIDEQGWNGIHYNSALDACSKLGTELIVKDNVKEFTGKCGPAIKELADEGCNMIILSSYGYTEETEDIINSYPNISFYCNSFDIHSSNLTSYFSRMYQARYFAGIAAGMKTENNKIGYVAAIRNNEVNRGINAFTLGVRRVNPDAVVTVTWSGDWDNEDAERKKADELINDIGVDVITYHQNQTYVIEEAEKAGIYSIGYHQSPDKHSEKYLATTACDWSLAYQAIIKQYLQGKSSENDAYWIGVEENAVMLSDFSTLIDEEIKTEIEKAKSEILSGKDVFSGEIYDNQKNLKCEDNESISDEILLEHCDWLAEGAEVYEK